MPRRRLRARVKRAIRWGGAGLCALILIIFVATLPWVFYLGRFKGLDGWTVAIWRGQVIVIVNDFDPARANLPPETLPPEMLSRRWKLRVDRSRPSSAPNDFPSPFAYRTRYMPTMFGWTFEGFVPLWPVFVVSLLCSGLTWIPRRRAPNPRRSCKYDLSGLPPGSPCPECAALTKR